MKNEKYLSDNDVSLLFLVFLFELSDFDGDFFQAGTVKVLFGSESAGFVLKPKIIWDLHKFNV